MFFLPRICEHCLNPSCVASCPSGAMYKRAEDGIVLVDQDQCRGWRMCVTGCPYKKVYFNHRTGKAEKCTFCYPRVEVGLPTVCGETCVGRLRYIGLFLYDADRVTAAASVEDEHDLYEAQLDLLLDPHDPAVVAAARGEGIAEDWIDAAQRSPVYRWPSSTGSRCRCTRSSARCRWSGTSRRCRRWSTRLTETGHDGEDAGNLFGAIDTLRIPVEYLAELFTAGDTAPVDARCCERWPRCAPTCATSPSAEPRDESIAAAVGMTGGEHREHVPAARASPSTRTATSSRPPTRERPARPRARGARRAASTSTAGPAWSAAARSARRPGGPTPVSVETFHALRRAADRRRARRRRPAAARG